MSAATPLDSAAIAAALGADASRWSIDSLTECDSTNTVLLARAEAGAPHGTVIVAARQSAGRGRRGRAWQQAEGAALAFSVLWRLPAGRQPAGLSLAVGVAVARAVSALGAAPVALKWPNDVLLGQGKLAGVLVELAPGLAAVIGIGINLELAAGSPLRALGATDLAAAIAAPAREDLLAALLRELHTVLAAFDREGFAALREDWQNLNAHRDLPVAVDAGEGKVQHGLCRGADHDGALLLDIDGRLERVLAGDVSLRPAP